jgi:carbon-monoxide dehydrogenase large subunit
MQQARDAAELIEFDYDELPVQLALAPGDTDIHSEAPGNLAFDWEMGDAEKPKRNLIRPPMW